MELRALSLIIVAIVVFPLTCGSGCRLRCVGVVVEDVFVVLVIVFGCSCICVLMEIVSALAIILMNLDWVGAMAVCLICVPPCLSSSQ